MSCLVFLNGFKKPIIIILGKKRQTEVTVRSSGGLLVYSETCGE